MWDEICSEYRYETSNISMDVLEGPDALLWASAQLRNCGINRNCVGEGCVLQVRSKSRLRLLLEMKEPKEPQRSVELIFYKWPSTYPDVMRYWSWICFIQFLSELLSINVICCPLLCSSSMWLLFHQRRKDSSLFTFSLGIIDKYI